MELRELIRSFIADGKDVVSIDIQPQNKPKVAEAQNQNQLAQDLDDTSLEIIDILEEYVKPAVASDGGHIESCSLCPHFLGDSNIVFLPSLFFLQIIAN